MDSNVDTSQVSTIMIVQILISIVTGIIGSLIAGVLFLCYLFTIRPRIDIATQIAKQEVGDGNADRLTFRIKIGNRTRKLVTDIRAELDLVEEKTVSSALPGKINNLTRISLTRSEILHLAPFVSDDRNTDYEFRFTTYEDIEAMLHDKLRKHDEIITDIYLRFTIYAKHSFSGFVSVDFRKYRKDEIIRGYYVSGESNEIKRRPVGSSGLELGNKVEEDEPAANENLLRPT